MAQTKKNFDITGAFDNATQQQEITSRIQAPVQNSQPMSPTASGSPRKTYIDSDGRPRRKAFRRDIERTHSKTVHFDDDTNALIDFAKSYINKTDTRQKTTVDDIIYDAVQYWFKNERKDILNIYETMNR